MIGFAAKFAQQPMDLPESQLIDKLVTQWHLSVSERRALPNGRAKGSLVKAAIVRLLLADGWFPRDWRPERNFDGGLMQRTDLGCNIHWKGETSYNRFDLLSIHEYTDVFKAAEQWVIRMWGDNIDGVPIDWNS